MGIATVTLNMFYEVAEYVKPPRTVHTKFVFGAPFGDPGNRGLQRKVIEECLRSLAEDEQGGRIREVEYGWKEEVGV